MKASMHGLDAAAPFISADAEINCNLASEWSELCVCGWGWRVPLWGKAFPNQDLQLKQHLAFPNDLAKLICIALQSIQQGWLSTQIPPEKSALGSGSLQWGWGLGEKELIVIHIWYGVMFLTDLQMLSRCHDRDREKKYADLSKSLPGCGVTIAT